MKNRLTEDQSGHLISLGVPKGKASAYAYVESHQYRGGIELPPMQVPIFRLTDLIGILPKEIEGEYINHSLCMSYGCDMPETKHNVWFAYYDELNDLEPKCAEELIDSLYELCVFCLEQRYLKFK